MSKSKIKKERQSIKWDNIQLKPEEFKFRSFTKIYPLSRQQIKEKSLRSMERKLSFLKKEKKTDFFDLNQEFLFALIQPIFLLDKQKMHNTIAKLILNSKLIDKLENDLENKETLNSSVNTFIKNLIYRRYEKDSILYRAGEIDNKFYFVIKGRISELKPKRINIEMSLDDYILYLIELKRNQELFLLDKVVKSNINLVFINSNEDIKKLNIIIFKKRLELLINSEDSEKILDNNGLESFFKEYNQVFENYNLSKKQLRKLSINRGKIILGVLNREWDDYILEHCKLTTDENLFFEKYEEIFKGNKKIFSCYIYEYNEEYIDNDYFGDFSLDEDKIKREETVRFEENTTIALINMDDYIDVISPQKKIEKKNDIMRLNNSFCFKDISERIFKKNYYDMFIKKQCSRNSILFNPETQIDSLIFIKKGNLSLQLNCSIIELHNLIKLIYNKLTNVSWPDESYQRRILPREYLGELEYKYFSDPIFLNMRSHDNLFKIELEKKRNFQIAVFSDFETVGLEEVYLQISHFAKAEVTGEKLFYNELPISKFNTLLHDEMRLIKESYIQVSVNRILSLLKRLHNIKQNYLNLSKLKSKADSLNEQKIIKEPNLEYNVDIANNRKMNINNNKTSIPQINLATMNNSEIKEEKNIRILFKKNKINSSTKKRNLNSAHFVKSAKKMRNKNLILDTDINSKERAKSGKYVENLDKEEDDEEGIKNKKKRSNIVIIGNKKINIKQLRKEIKKLILANNFEENPNEQKNKIDSINVENHSNLFDKSHNESFENQNGILFSKNNLNSIKSRILKREDLSIKITENDNFKKGKNNYSLLNRSNNSLINDYSKKINLFFPLSINPINLEIIHNKKSKHLNQYSENNINDNVKIIQTLPHTHEIENSKLNILPKIEPKIKLNGYLNYSSNLNSITINSNRNKCKGKIPEIVKNFYLEKKQKGCIPLIVNKRSNTIFLRKYHKKYNEN